MMYIYDRDVVRNLNRIILDYGFERIYEEINSNGIMRIYKNETVFENYTLTLKLDYNGINVKLLDIEKLIYSDELSLDIIKMYAVERIDLSILIDIIIDSVYEFLEDLDKLKQTAKRGCLDD